LSKTGSADQLSVSITNKEIIKLAAPISLSMLIPQINFFTNTVFLGKVGPRELGVNGITGVFYLMLSMIGYGLSSGMQVQMARRAGEGDKSGIARILTNGAMLALLFSLGMMLLTLWVSPLLFGYSLDDQENFSLSIGFIYTRVWGLPFLMITQLLCSYFIAIGRSGVLIWGALVATLVNILFDYMLIFGNWGFPEMGFRGAAVASVVSEIFYCLTMVGAFFFLRLHREYPIFRYRGFDSELSQRTLKVSAPLIVQFMFSIGGWLIFFIFIEHLGGLSLAASQVLRNIFGIVSVGTWALAVSCNTMVSNIIGQGRRDEVISVVIKICKISLVYAAVLCVLMLSFAQEFLSIYSDDVKLVAYALPSLRVIVLATLIMSISTVVFNGVVGTGNTLVNLTMEVSCVGTYLVYCYFIIRRWHSPLYVCWGSEFVYWLSLLTCSAIYLRSGRWKGKEI
jgi:MATE family multidrug resistance protein